MPPMRNDNRDNERAPALRRLTLLRPVAAAALYAEKALPQLLPPLGIAALFLSAVWLSLFRIVPDWLRWLLLAGFAIAFLVSLAPLARLRWPRRAEAERFLEARNGLAHQPIGVQEDRPAFETPLSQALWREHRARMAARVENLGPGLPRPDIAGRDRYGLRALPALLLFAAFGYSFSNNAGSIADAFRPAAAGLTQAADLRIDAWATPPAYTGRAPVFLTANAIPAETAAPVALPQDSLLTIRISGRISGNGGEQAVLFSPVEGEPVTLEADAPAQAPGNAANTPLNYTMRIDESGTITVGERRWQFDVIPDRVPEIAFSSPPRRSVNGALEIAFTAKDDYGIRAAHAEIEPAEPQAEGAMALYPPPEYRLNLPQRDSRDVKGVTSRSLTEHPLAGKRVRITLVATDAVGQTGRSPAHEMQLPAHAFSEPLAAAVAEQRQVFSLDTRQVPRALDLSDALVIRPEETIPKLTNFLLIRSARERLSLARGEEALRDTADYLWEIALGIEEGDLSLAERRLREAQRNLDEALEKGAPDEEIARLMQELRDAMDQFMNELARRLQNAPQAQSAMEPQNMLRQRDLQNMMNQIENLARSGNRDAARQMLSELQRLMNNLLAGRPQRGQQQSQQDNSPMRRQIDRLGELMQEQQKLMDETFRLGQALRDRLDFGDPFQGEQRPGQPQQGQQQQQQQGRQQGQQNLDGMTAEQLRQALRDLQAQQQGLGQKLGELQQGLSDLGMDPVEGFGEAGREMGNAGRALGEGEGERAVEGQGNALNALRRGAQGMMQQMMQAMRQGQQPGEGQGEGEGQTGNAGRNGRDPLGRPRAGSAPDFGDSVKVPDEIDVQRAREILETIREKLGNAPAGEIERQYLERLLDIR